jgi:hypothetical protein
MFRAIYQHETQDLCRSLRHCSALVQSPFSGPSPSSKPLPPASGLKSTRGLAALLSLLSPSPDAAMKLPSLKDCSEMISGHLDESLWPPGLNQTLPSPHVHSCTSGVWVLISPKTQTEFSDRLYRNTGGGTEESYLRGGTVLPRGTLGKSCGDARVLPASICRKCQG